MEPPEDRTPPTEISKSEPVLLDADDTKALRKALKQASKRCQWQSILSIVMVVFSIIACIGALLLGDRVEDLFMSDAKRRALNRADEARWKLLEKTATLDDKVAQDIEPAYEKVRKALGFDLDTAERMLPPSNPAQGTPTPQPDAADLAKPAEASVDLSKPPAEPSDYIDAKTVSLPVEEYDLMKKQIVGLQSQASSLSTEVSNLKQLTDEGLRAKVADLKEDLQSMEKQISAKDTKIAAGEAVREGLWKSREQQNEKIGTLNEKMATAASMVEVRSMVSSAFIRGGALFLLVWLVRIFIRKHQHAVNGMEFYNAALNALQIKSVTSLAQFKEALSLLRHGHFELRDADIELLSDKLRDHFSSLIKLGSK